ncbi:hypothetical protein [Actinomadura sp. HBU206391]|uniref:hypothetical protein n=1 Tax=Actinomadura sp. HBU206391 TaxID=2731692 RepID=UPI0016508226|nr:hypothetical protein [Actinomadura sp. HBU206391]MBC6463223.1 hypothetical protein [Actinomadura sp. HBU206391]
MSSHETLTWSATHERSGCLAGALAGLSAGMIIMVAPALMFSLQASALFLIVGIFVAGGALVGTFAGPREVHAAEFTRRRVRLVSAVASRTMEIADLTEIAVEHSGDTETGYARTSLRLRWPGETGVRLVGHFDAELVRSLGRVLGPGRHVEETWKDLESPPAGA